MLMEISKMEQRYDAVMAIMQGGFTVAPIGQRLSCQELRGHVTSSCTVGFSKQRTWSVSASSFEIGLSK
jgi:hypoxanthine phosphoribosyltransferase